MKIAMFTETWFPQVNGVVSSTSWFVDELVRQGHEVEIFAPAPGESSYNGVPVHRFKSFAFRPYPEFRATLPPVRINRLVKGKGFDVIHTHGPFSMGLAGLYAARRNKIPVVSTFHTPISDYVHYLFKGGYLHLLGQKVAWAYSVKHYNRYETVISPSRVIKLLLEEKGVTAPIGVIPTGLELKRFRFPRATAFVRKKYGLEGGFVLHTGRLSREKNVADILKAWDGMDAPLVITSRGPELERLKRAAPGNVKFVGFVSERELVALYKEAAFTVIASGAETQGLVILEAMACGSPVLGADWLAIPETVKHNKNGMLFRLHDWRDLRMKAEQMLHDQRLRARLSRNARKTAEKNTIQVRARELVQLYSSL